MNGVLSALLVFAVTAGILKWMRFRRISKWFVASVPWWVMASSSGWYEFGAALLTLGGIIALAVGPTLPGRLRGRSKEPPLSQLANGPLAPVEPRTYNTAKPSRAISILTIVFFVLTIALTIATGAGGAPEATGALALSCLIIAVTFAFSNWFSGRVRLRIDQHGVHSRVFFAEQTIRWADVAGLTIRNVFLPGMGIRMVYYVVFSPTNEFNFASSMTGAKELQAAIEAATGVTFPEPTITSNF